MNKFYITNSIPYVNAKPHIGHALEFIQSDVIARYHKILGDEVLLLSGGDENALKNVQAAEKAGKRVQEFVDENTQAFYDLAKKLNTEFDVWQKGSDPKHHAASQKLWELCQKAGDIYKKTYKGLYCVGCEQFYTKDELDENGQCFEHPGKPLEEVEEENYFFKLSKYQEPLKKLISEGTLNIVPQFRKNEMLSFLKKSLEDISISRSNQRAKNWGVPVPNDAAQRMYVWFDALNIYQSGVGFGSDEQKYKKWWPADLHVIGKGIIRFHAIYWPAFLLSANLELPKELFVHEYFTVNGQKMSKTLGNVIDPFEIIEKYGAETLRYYCLAKFSPFSDGDFAESKLKEVYNADLANGLGNLIARVAKLCETSQFSVSQTTEKTSVHLLDVEEYSQALTQYRFNDALSFVWQKITKLDKYINEEKPWDLLKTNDQRLKTTLAHSVDQIQEIAVLLEPFLPVTAKQIEDQFKGPKIISQKPLFPRL
ncbi:MAG TPA: methionine--tRNA ligase [Candidatus Saccharimonadales bacterium]|nr:methionine--tRNA ligase [Candidatus Saccharimonadales bacterium]